MITELRYWHDRVLAAEAELDAATTHADLKLAAARLMRARRHLLTLLDQPTMVDQARPPRRRRRPPQPTTRPQS